MSKWHAILSRVWCCGNAIQGRRNLLKVLPRNNLRHVGQDNSIGADYRGELSPPVKHKTLRRVRTYTMHHRSFIQWHLLGRTIQRHLVGRGVPRYFMGQAVSRHFIDRKLQRALHATSNQTPGQTNTLNAPWPFGHIVKFILATTAPSGWPQFTQQQQSTRSRIEDLIDSIFTEFWSVPSQRGEDVPSRNTSARHSARLFFIFIYWNSQFVHFGHLVEFFNSYINMLVAPQRGAIFAFARLYPLWGLLGASFSAFCPCLWFWTFPQLAGLGVLLFLICIFLSIC